MSHFHDRESDEWPDEPAPEEPALDDADPLDGLCQYCGAFEFELHSETCPVVIDPVEDYPDDDDDPDEFDYS